MSKKKLLVDSQKSLGSPTDLTFQSEKSPGSPLKKSSKSASKIQALKSQYKNPKSIVKKKGKKG